MNSVKQDREREQLLRLIDRYFEGETTVAEERKLRSMLAETTLAGEEIEEARAVMGVFATARKAEPAVGAQTTEAPRRRSLMPLAAITAAASIAVIIVAVLALMNPGKMAEGDLMAATATDEYDSIAKIRRGEGLTGGAGHNMLAMVSGGVNRPDSPDEIAALISSEMGLMAEAERSMYESIAEDLTLLRDIPASAE